MQARLATAIAKSGNGSAGHASVEEMFDGIDDLIKRVADVDSPEILRVRARVHAGLIAAKSAFARCAHHFREPAASMVDDIEHVGDAGDAPDAGDEVDRLPARELGLFLLLGLGLGLVAALRQY